MNKKFLPLICITLLTVSAFIVYAGKRMLIQLPPPPSACGSELNWHGLIAGQSSREDVLNILGEPVTKGKIKFEGNNISYFAYKVYGGRISEYAMDRIFFRPNGIVDWMEIVQADRDGEFTVLYDTVIQVGNHPDVVYTNNNYLPSNGFMDVKFYPDQVYVWSACGLAADVLSNVYSPEIQGGHKECVSSEDLPQSSLCNLSPRYPTPYNFGDEPKPDVNSIVLMKFYFQPTSYEAFTNYYMHKIPYGIWDMFLDSYQ